MDPIMGGEIREWSACSLRAILNWGGLGMCCLLFASGCAVSQIPQARMYRLVRGPVFEAPLPGERLMDHTCLVDGSNDIWVFARVERRSPPSLRVACVHYDGTSWAQLPDVFTHPWSRLSERSDEGKPAYPLVEAVWAKKGTPMLVWTPGTSESWTKERGYQLLCSIWSGTAWGNPKPIEGVFIGASRPWRRFDLSVARDRQGRTHVVYRGNLVPREVYSRQIVEAHWPHKPFSVEWMNGRWGRPRSIQGRSRLAYSRPMLSAGSHKIHLVTTVHSTGFFGRGPDQIEYRGYHEGRWEAAERLPGGTSGDYLSDPSIAEDDAGNLHLVYEGTGASSSSGAVVSPCFYRCKRDGHWESPMILGDRGGEPRVVNDADGNVYCFWRDRDPFPDGTARLQAWNSRGRTDSVTTPAGFDVRFFQGTDGAVYLTWATGTTVCLQRLSLARL